MKVEQSKPRSEIGRITSMGGGITSPYAKPPLAPVFVVSYGDGARFTLDEDEARELHAVLTQWIDEMPNRKQRIEAMTDAG